MDIRLRPYQIDVINSTLATNKNTLIQIPTGGGKTIISKEIIRSLIHKGLQVLFVAPKKVLMNQTAREFDELNPHIIHGVNEYNKNHHLLISTNQTACRREIEPDVIFIDEIHYGFDGKMIKSLLKNKSNVRLIGLSATPYDKNGKLLEGFGCVLDKYDISYMIENKYLVNLKSYELVKIYNLNKVKVTAGDYNLSELSKIVSNNQTILEIVNTTLEYIYEHKKTIVFAVDINHAELLTKAYQHEGFIAKALHSKMSSEEINKEINLFKEGKTKILVSVLMLTTGFDVPDTDVAVIARPTKSQNLYKQMVGRILRLANEKDYAILLDCGNVIETLGMPLEPIKERVVVESENINKCKSCKSKNIKLQKKDTGLVWICSDCGFCKNIEEGAYECMICKKTYTHDAKFDIKKNKLYLVCNNCPYPTLISEFIGDEKFVEVRSNKKTTFESKKSLEKILMEKRKVREEEINNKKKLEEFEKRIISRFRSQYLSLNQNNRGDLIELRNYIQSLELKDKYNKMKLKLIKQNNGYFDIPYICEISNTDDFLKKLVTNFYSSYLNNLYESKIKFYLRNFLTETLMDKTQDFVLNYEISKSEFIRVIEVENEFFQNLEDNEKELIIKLDKIVLEFSVNSGSYTTNINFQRDN